MNNGRIGGKQYLSEEYVKAATSRQIDNMTSGHRDYMHGNGYGYQIWMLKDGAYAFVGMGMQLAVCIPKHDFLFVCTGDTQGSLQVYSGIFELLWSEIVEKLHSDPLPEDEASARRLEEKLRALRVVNPLIGKSSSPWQEKIDGRTYALKSNPMGIDRLRVEFNGNIGTLVIETRGQEKRISFGMEEYVEGFFPQTNYYGDTIGTPKGEMYKCMAVARWTQENKLVIRCYIIDDYFGNLTITLGFKDKELGLCMTKTAEWFLEEYEGCTGGCLVE
jgi:hypothetical protein